MAFINKIENVASINYEGNIITSLPAETVLLTLPVITKTVDKEVASIGDTLTYIIIVSNLALTNIENLPFSDVIPEGCEYIENSFMLNGLAATPTFEERELRHTIPTVPALGSVNIEFKVLVTGVSED